MAQFSSEATIAKGYRDISDRQNQCGLKLLGEISLTPGGVVLDMGCGSGYLASVLAEHVGPAGRVIAVDPDAGRVKVLHIIIMGSDQIYCIWILLTFQPSQFVSM